jgi:DNA topoisomerase-1
MSYKLVIVESPAKCEKIESYLGSEYKCVASFGHLQELKSLKDIDINNNCKPRFSPIQSKSKQIDYIRSKIINAKEVILATDDDREGEAISWHICNLFNLPITTTKRIIFHEITKPAILQAINNPTILNMNIVNSQFGRQILDILVGYKITPVLWEKISRTKKLSAGRCQTIALRLVYDRQNEINNSKSVKSYNTTGYFSDKNIPFTLNHNFEDEKQLIVFLEDSKTHTHNLVIEKPKDSIRHPPLPFNTSSLQQAASNELHCSPKVTMFLCQKLYESGYITYMRTETKKYSNDFIKSATEFITNSYGNNYVNSSITSFKLEDPSNNTTTQPHEAIRPTNISLMPASIDITKQEKLMYNLIWKNTIESCMSNALFKTLLVKINAPQKYEYSYCCESVVFLGWKIIAYNNNKNSAIDATKTMAYEYLPKITNKLLPYKKIVSKLTLKAIKSHYGEACLINLLEEKGIGRPSTFSSLIEKIQNRGYVKLENITGQLISCQDYYLETNTISVVKEDRQFGNEKNKLVIQPTGILVIELLIRLYPTLFDYEYTKNMESNLDIIAHGNKNYWELCLDCLREINNLNNLNNLNTPKQVKTLIKSEDIIIDNNHVYMIGKYGPVIKCLISDPPTFLSVKQSIDLTKLKNQEYKLEDIIEKNVVLNKILGKYNGTDVILKKGKFGLYVCWDKNKKSLNNINTEESKIVLEDVIKIIENNKSSNENILREISKEISIRKGKGSYGDYIFYKTSKMSKPKFIKLNKFKEDYLTCPSINIINFIQK